MRCNGRRFKSSCTYSCNKGYSLIGGKVKQQCGATGKWDSRRPTCKRKKCGKLSIQNGRLRCNGQHYRHKCAASCYKGYRLTGSRTRTCEADGLWCNKPAKCVIKSCGMPKIPANTDVSCKGTVYGNKCTHKCKRGFAPWGRSGRGHWKRTKQCQADARWRGWYLGPCRPMQCRRVRAPLGGTVSCPNGRSGPTGKSGQGFCTFSCQKGLRLIGAKKVTCNLAGGGKSVRWSGGRPRCVGVSYGLVKLKTHWNDFVTIGSAQCQRRANSHCKCMNFRLKRPEWGLDSQCCSQPAQDRKARPWCYCENSRSGTDGHRGMGWRYCESKYKEKRQTIDHFDKQGGPFTNLNVRQYYSRRRNAHMRFGRWVTIKTQSNWYLCSHSNGHVYVSRRKHHGRCRWKPVYAYSRKKKALGRGRPWYKGYVGTHMKLGFKNRWNKYMVAENRNSWTYRRVRKTVYRPACRKGVTKTHGCACLRWSPRKLEKRRVKKWRRYRYHHCYVHRRYYWKHFWHGLESSLLQEGEGAGVNKSKPAVVVKKSEDVQKQHGASKQHANKAEKARKGPEAAKGSQRGTELGEGAGGRRRRRRRRRSWWRRTRRRRHKHRRLHRHRRLHKHRRCHWRSKHRWELRWHRWWKKSTCDVPYPKPGLRRGYRWKRKKMRRSVACQQPGGRCMAANRGWLYGWEQFNVVSRV